jgi:hypothetical protein
MLGIFFLSRILIKSNAIHWDCPRKKDKIIFKGYYPEEGVNNMSERIFIVDDERDIADLLEVYLQNENYFSVQNQVKFTVEFKSGIR